MENKTNKSMIDHFRVLVELELKSFIIIFGIFLFLSLTDTISEIYLQDIIKLSGIEVVNLPKPSLKGVFQNTWGDFIFTGAIVIIFYGAMAFSSDAGIEKSIYFYLSRPVSRRSYYLGRSIVKSLVILFTCVLSSILIYLFGILIFPAIDFISIFYGSLIIALGLISFLSLVLMFNSRTSTFVSVGAGVIILILMSTLTLITGYIKWTKWFSPLILSSIWSEILNGNYEHLLPNTFGLILWIIIPLTIGTYLFNKRDL